MDQEPTAPTKAQKGKPSISLVIGVVAIILSLATLGMGLSGQLSSDNTALQNSLDETNAQLASLQTTLDEVELQQGFSVNDTVNRDGYQAVFLTNDQVYFGKLEDGLPGQVRLTDIYYLQVDGGTYEQGGVETGSISLAKLGNELHGPEDEMNITRDNLIFWENLKADGQVTQAIIDFQNNR